MIITIDGFAGTGKSSVARELAKKLDGFRYLSTGATYRAVALYFIENNLDVGSQEDLQKALSSIKITVDFDKRRQITFLNGKNVSRRIREPDVDHLVPVTSDLNGVRTFLNEINRGIATHGNFVVEGRDIGKVVLPEAEYKFWLEASIEEKAKRRKKQQIDQGIEEDFDKIMEGIKRRDEMDIDNTFKPDGAIVIDTDPLDLMGVVEEIYRQVK